MATTVLTDEKARELDERLCPRATQLNPRQLADFVRREVAEVDPEGHAKRAEMAKEDRRVSIEPASDGMGWLNLFHTAEDLQAIKNRIDQLMRELPKDDRTADQRRADIVRDLILGGTSNVQAHIYVTVDATTLLGLDDLPGDLRGYGPLPADRIRDLAYRLKSEWSGVLVDDRGYAQTMTSSGYRFRGKLAEFIRLRDRTCDHPGCSRAAEFCEIHHTTPYDQGGRTDCHNGRCRCRFHHRAKQSPFWTVTQDDDGTTNWACNLGKTYATKPQPVTSPTADALGQVASG